MQWMKFVFLIVLFSIAIHRPASAQCQEGDCQNGQGVYTYPSGARYVGQFSNHMANGSGVLYFANGDIYDGEWNQHVREGKGRFTSKSQFVYEGHFKKNKFDGTGKMSFQNNDVYEGEFRNGTFHGAGIYLTSGGEKIEGQWVEGEPVNRRLDLLTTEDSEQKAQSTSTSGNVKDCMNAACDNEIGRFVYRDGTVYTGMFQSGQPSGEGRVEYVNGDVYLGQWKNHAPHGEGVVHYQNGRSYGAIWNNGRPVKELSADHPMIKETVEVDYDAETKIWAVIIGVSRYNHMPALKYTDDDAFHLYAFLKSPEGGAIPDEQISLLIDEQGNRKDIISSLQQTLYKADENDVVIVYYSGHGLQGRLIPSDFDGYSNAVKYDEIKNIVEQSNAQHKIVITDACHSGSLLAARNPLSFQLSGFYQQLSEARNGIAFITSSKGEEVSLESSGLRHGIFSHYLIQGLRGAADENDDAIVTISELYNFIEKEVRTYTNAEQNPMIFGNYDPDMPIAFVRK
jgi:hypothetical protein